MRIEYDMNNLIIYIKNNKVLDDRLLCQSILDKIDKYFNIKLKGFYDVNIYKDKNNMVIEFIEDNIDIADYYSKADLNIRELDTIFLYEIKDILDTNIDSFYLYNNKYYILFNNVDNNNVEFGSIIYKDTEEIIENANLITM